MKTYSGYRSTTGPMFVEATTTLVRLLANALDHPADEKFRRVRENNATLRAKLLQHAGGRDALLFGCFCLLLFCFV